MIVKVARVSKGFTIFGPYSERGSGFVGKTWKYGIINKGSGRLL